MTELEKAEERLKKYNQEQIIEDLEKLDKKKQENIIKQINEINFVCLVGEITPTFFFFENIELIR